MRETRRIEELEGALRDVIEYLRALPAHPQTYKTANRAEEVLSRKAMPTVYETSLYTPAGILMLGAVLQGKFATVRTDSTLAATPELAKYQERHKDVLFKALIHGLPLPHFKKVKD